MPTKRYSPITPAQMASFRTEASAHGIVVPEGNSGTVDGPMGVQMTFAYDGTENLDLTITKKPWYLPAAAIWSDLQPFFS